MTWTSYHIWARITWTLGPTWELHEITCELYKNESKFGSIDIKLAVQTTSADFSLHLQINLDGAIHKRT